MGNRAVVVFDEYAPNSTAVYLHWNGGRDSILGILEATKRIMRGDAEPKAGERFDQDYAKARFIIAAGVVLPNNASLGVGKCGDFYCDNGDNGVYVVDSETLEIKERHHFSGTEQMEYDTNEFADDIMAELKKIGYK